MTTTCIPLLYGRQELSVEVPDANLLGVYYPGADPGALAGPNVPGPDRLLQQAMANPLGTPRLREMAIPGQKIAIITSDLTRPTPSGQMLPFVIEELEAAGIPDNDVVIVLALGLHRPMTEQEIATCIPPEIYQRYRVINHDPEDTIHLGVTSRGTPVEIFRPVVEADLRICLGNIEFHYFAGYSGGAKAILPGCASRKCVTANHSWMIKPGAAAASLDDNPVRLDLEEGVAMLGTDGKGVDFILNVVLDNEHQIAAAYAGDVREAHRLGCDFVHQRGTVDTSGPGDIVIASAGGFPKDINYYQAHKALENARYFVRPGGVIILVAECSEGIGNKLMEQWLMDIPSADETLHRIQQEFVLGGHKAAAIAMIQKQADIYLVSGMPDAAVRQMRCFPFPAVQVALDTAIEKLGTGCRVVVLPLAGSTLPSSIQGTSQEGEPGAAQMVDRFSR